MSSVVPGQRYNTETTNSKYTSWLCMYITCIYRRPNNLLAPTKAVIGGIRHRRKSIVMCDLNARHTSWNCLSYNELGKYIFQQPIIMIHPGVQKFRHSANPRWTSTLDLLLTNSPHLITGCQALDYGLSDHRPIIFEVEEKPSTPPAPTNYEWKCTRQPLMKAWRGYNIDVAAIVRLAETIIGSADYCILRVAPKPNYQREVSAHILQLVSQRNRLKKPITGLRTRKSNTGGYTATKSSWSDEQISRGEPSWSRRRNWAGEIRPKGTKTRRCSRRRHHLLHISPTGVST